MRAQLTEPVYSVPSADVAALGEFGEVPVSHYTGVPDISIPLYSMQYGSRSWPIGLAYHLGSVKPCEQPGSVGLGWAPLWDACITRTVRGLPDEKKTSTGHEPGFYGNRLRGRTLQQQSFWDATRNHLQTAATDQWYEMSADEFSFNVADIYGRFYLNEHGDWTVVSEKDVRVEFNAQSGFLSLSDLSGSDDIHSGVRDDRIPGLSGWPYRDKCTRFFGEFTLIGPDGTRYTFGGADATDFSIDYYSRATSDLIATAWHIRRIETPEGKTVSFEYEDSMPARPVMVDLRYVTGYRLVSEGGYIGAEPFTDIKGRSAFNGFLLYPSLLKKIVTEDEEAEFTWDYDRIYNTSYLLHSGEALCWDNTTADWFCLLPAGLEQPQTGDRRRRVIADALCHKMLHRIAVRSRHVVGGVRWAESFYFDYEGVTRKRLAGITARAGAPELTYSLIAGGGLAIPYLVTPPMSAADSILSVADVPGAGIRGFGTALTEGGTALPQWSFDYNTKKEMPHGYVFPKTDAWGYWTGTVRSPAMNYSPRDGTVSVATGDALLSGTLRHVTWPTGGTTEFLYEGNSWTNRLSADRQTLETASGRSGGLRVKETVSRTADGSVASRTRYDYTDSGMYDGGPVFCRTYDMGGLTVTLWSESGFKSSATGYNSPDVGYSTVIEERLDSAGVSSGRIRYTYSNYGADVYGDSHRDESPFYSVGVEGGGIGVPFTSHSTERGKLLRKEWFDAAGSLLRRESYRYGRIRDTSMVTATQQVVSARYYDNTAYTQTSIAPVGWLTRTPLYAYLPVEKETTEFTTSGPVTLEKSYQGWSDALLLPRRDSTLTSSGGWRVTRTDYEVEKRGTALAGGEEEDDEDEVVTAMEEQHMLSYPWKVETVFPGGERRTVEGRYGIANNPGNGVIANLPYLRKVTKSGKDVYKVLSTDANARPERIVADSLHSTLGWAFGGKRLSWIADNTRGGGQHCVPKRHTGRHSAAPL